MQAIISSWPNNIFQITGVLQKSWVPTFIEGENRYMLSAFESWKQSSLQVVWKSISEYLASLKKAFCQKDNRVPVPPSLSGGGSGGSFLVCLVFLLSFFTHWHLY